ncbi:MAG: NlpC/P60 family protein [Solirubrobacteraceae bacterium]
MTPHLDPRARRALAALGALGATTFTAAMTNDAPASTRPARTPFAPSFTFSSTGLEVALSEPLVAQFERANPLAARALEQRQDRHASAEGNERRIDKMIAAGNRIAKSPYIWGGGHGSFTSPGYDCSGSVSYVLHAAGVLSTPEDSSQLMSYGIPGRGKHITIYANGGHAWMTIDGRRFDTIALQETGIRWSRTIPPTAGYVAVHPAGM